MNVRRELEAEMMVAEMQAGSEWLTWKVSEQMGADVEERVEGNTHLYQAHSLEKVQEFRLLVYVREMVIRPHLWWKRSQSPVLEVYSGSSNAHYYLRARSCHKVLG